MIRRRQRHARAPGSLLPRRRLCWIPLLVLAALLLASQVQAQVNACVGGGECEAVDQDNGVDALNTLGGTANGWYVYPATGPADYDVEVVGDISTGASEPAVIVVSTDPRTGSIVSLPYGVFVIKNPAARAVNGGLQTDSSVAVANNGTLRSTDASFPAFNATYDIDDGGLAAALRNGYVAIVNGEAGVAGNQNATIYSQGGNAVQIKGAYLLINRGRIGNDAAQGEDQTVRGVFIEANPAGSIGDGLPGFDIDIDLSRIPELEDLEEVPNEVENHGTISGSEYGVRIQSSFEGKQSVLNRAGAISSSDGIGVSLRSPSERNGRLLIENSSGALIAGVNAAVEMVGTGSVDNAGELTATNGTVVIFPSTGDPDEDSQLSNTLTNRGEIRFWNGQSAVDMGPGEDLLTNSSGGVIELHSGSSADSASILILGGEGSDTVENSGSITAPTGWTAIFMGPEEEVDNVVNQPGGVIDAPGAVAIDMGPGDDLVNLNGGRVAGQIRGGDGFDTLAFDGAGTLQGDVLDTELIEVRGPINTSTSGWQVDGDIVTSYFSQKSGLLTSNGLLRTNDLTVDSGELVLEGPASAAFTTVGSGGILTVNSQLDVDVDRYPVWVKRGGVVAGNGIVNGPVQVAGRIGAGRADAGSGVGGLGRIGRLEIGGDLEFLSGGGLEIHYDSLSNDILDVQGDLIGEDGDVLFLPLGGTAVEHELSVFLNYDGVRQVDLSAGSTAVFDYEIVYGEDDPNDVIPFGSIGFSFQQSNYEDLVHPNHKSLARVLDDGRCSDCGELGELFQVLDRLETAEEVDYAVGSIGAETLGVNPVVSFANMTQYNESVVTNLRNRRLLLRGTKPAREGLKIPLEEQGDWLFLALGHGLFSNLDSLPGFSGYSSSGGGASMGTYRYFGDHFLLGFTGGLTYTSVKSDLYKTHTQIVTPRVGAFGGVTVGGWYADIVASYGYDWIQSTRQVVIDTLAWKAESQHRGHELSGYLGSGYLFGLGLWSFGPSASLQYAKLFESSYQEHDAGLFGLKVESAQEPSVESRIGLRMAREVHFTDGIDSILQLSADWAREWVYSSHRVKAEMSGLDGKFDTLAGVVNENRIAVGAGIKAYLEDSIVVEVDYRVDVGDQGYLAHGFTALWTVEF